ncbi:hypothetical protein G6F65_019365 [Rhizopus arrhizus]|nr:hypothetical protein G6F65_019365 [Rhizopus arrhizus]
MISIGTNIQAAHGGGGDVADRQRQDERGAADPDDRHAVQQDDGAQHQARQRQVFCAGEGAVGHGAEAAAHADQADLDERQADQQHHDAGAERGDQAFDEGQDAADAHLDERAGDDDAEDRGHDGFDRGALLDHDRAARDQRSDEVEAGALHDEQACAQRAEALALHVGGDAGDDQRHRHDQRGVAAADAKRLADQETRGAGRSSGP